MRAGTRVPSGRNTFLHTPLIGYSRGRMSGHRDVKIVLVRPRDPRNIGAACRAMKCMELHSLAIVIDGLISPVPGAGARALRGGRAGRGDRPHRPSRGHRGRGAGCSTTRRRGRNRKYFTVFPSSLHGASRPSARGPSRCSSATRRQGSTMRSSPCNLAVTIPVRAVPFPESLARGPGDPYEIHRALAAGHLTPFSPIGAQAVDDLVSVITGSLKGIGFLSQVTPRQMAVFFKDILARAGLSVNEAKRMGVIFRKIAGLAGPQPRRAGTARLTGTAIFHSIVEVLLRTHARSALDAHIGSPRSQGTLVPGVHAPGHRSRVPARALTRGAGEVHRPLRDAEDTGYRRGQRNAPPAGARSRCREPSPT